MKEIYRNGELLYVLIEAYKLGYTSDDI